MNGCEDEVAEIAVAGSGVDLGEGAKRNSFGLGQAVTEEGSDVELGTLNAEE